MLSTLNYLKCVCASTHTHTHIVKILSKENNNDDGDDNNNINNIVYSLVMQNRFMNVCSKTNS